MADKIEILKLTGTIVSALVSSIVIAALWYSSVNYKLLNAQADIIDTKQHITVFESRCNDNFSKIYTELNTSKTDTAVERALLREISVRLDRMENKIDNFNRSK